LIEDVALLRYRIAARDGLISGIDMLLYQARTIDNRRITSDMLTILPEKEISEVEAYGVSLQAWTRGGDYLDSIIPEFIAMYVSVQTAFSHTTTILLASRQLM
jgi:hypothetical protein